MHLSLKVLDLLYLLVKYGYYADLQDINVLTPPLISLLDGMNDMPFPCTNPISSKYHKQIEHFRKACATQMYNINLVDVAMVGGTI